MAHVLVSKYADHLPLYRQSQIYARQGIELDRSSLADWVGRAAAELRPLHERLFEHLKRSPKLFMDETRAPVLDPGRKRTKTGYLWALARDDRPWAGPDPDATPCHNPAKAEPCLDVGPDGALLRGRDHRPSQPLAFGSGALQAGQHALTHHARSNSAKTPII